MFSTHPATEDRTARLEALRHRSTRDSLMRARSGCMPRGALRIAFAGDAEWGFTMQWPKPLSGACSRPILPPKTASPVSKPCAIASARLGNTGRPHARQRDSLMRACSGCMRRGALRIAFAGDAKWGFTIQWPKPLSGACSRPILPPKTASPALKPAPQRPLDSLTRWPFMRDSLMRACSGYMPPPSSGPLMRILAPIAAMRTREYAADETSAG
jgi:hypothetical protein